MLTFGPHLDGYYDVADQWIHHQRRQAEALLAAQQARKDAIRSVAEFEAHRARIRQQYLRAIGGLPIPDGEPRPDLRAEITGTLDRGSYHIEKLLYQSLPGFYVTAALYVPKALSAPAPAVLFVCGHSELGKAYPVYQQVAIDLVENGFVVLAMDPPGQGERFQYWDPAEGKRVIGGCTTEHSYAGLQTMLLGASVSRWFTWDAIRAVDYLGSRPEVDGRRIGITGNSGGGTQSCLMMLAEPRLAAAVPCTFPMTLESYHATGQAQDAEQYLPGCFVHGPDHDDYLTMLAPKPVLVGAVAYDFFPIEGTLTAVERARRIYALYDAEENVDLAIAPTRHEYAPQLREAAVNWFRKHLAGLAPDFRAGTPETLPPEALHVTESGQVLQSIPLAKTLHDLTRDLAQHLQPRMPLQSNDHPPARDLGELRKTLMHALSLADTDRQAAIYPRIIWEGAAPEGELEGFLAEKLFFFSEPGICVSAVLLHPERAPDAARPLRPTVVLLLENGTAALPEEAPRVKQWLEQGFRVLVFDPRGIGGVQSRPFCSDRRPHNLEWRLGWDAVMMGGSTLGARVCDVLRAHDYLRWYRTDVGEIHLHGVDSGATWAWLAAACEYRIAAVTLENGLTSYRDLVETRYYDSHRYDMRTLTYDLLRQFDLPDLLPLLAPRPVTILSPRNAKGEPVDPAAHLRMLLARAGGELPEGWLPEVH